MTSDSCFTANTNTDLRNGVNGDVGCKYPCQYATTGNIDLNGLQTIDGISVNEGDIVLVKDQTDQTENGVYVASTGYWQRGVWFNNILNSAAGSLVAVAYGSANAGTIWMTICSTPQIVFGTSLVTFQVKISGTVGIPANSILGNNGGVTQPPFALNVGQVNAMLPAFTGDSGSGGVKGLVPAPSAGDAAAGKFLKADGTFQAPSYSTSSVQAGQGQNISIVSQNITVNSVYSVYVINTSTPANLNAISGATNGQIIYLTLNNDSGNYCSIQSLVGNIFLSGNQPFYLTNYGDWIALVYEGGSGIYQEIARGGYSINTAALFQEVQSSGTSPANLVGGVTRVLNTTQYNSIPGASLSGNQMTLPSGNYDISANSPNYGSNALQAYLYNVTTSTIVELGTSTSALTGQGVVNQSIINGRFTNNATNVYELRCYSADGSANLGYPTSSGHSEIYSSVFLRRIG